MPSSLPPRKRRWLTNKTMATLLAIAMMFAVVACVANPPGDTTYESARPSPPTATIDTPTPKGGYWSAPIDTGIPEGVEYFRIDLDLGDVIVLAYDTSTSRQLVAIDLHQRQVAWTTEVARSESRFFGDASGLVTFQQGLLTTIDPKSGFEWAGSLPSKQTVLWAGQGMILTRNSDKNTICGRSMEDVTSCVWTKKASPRGPYVFAGGFVNTGEGVVRLSTGKPAGFGSDAGSGSKKQTVYYVGSSANRVLRVVGPNSGLTFQPWDTENDTAFCPPVKAGHIVAPAEFDVYAGVSTQGGHGANLTVVYSWGTDTPLWSMDTHDGTKPAAGLTLFAGDALVTVVETSLVVALEQHTGQRIWETTQVAGLAMGVKDGILFFLDFQNLQAVGYDTLHGFSLERQIDLPAGSSGERCWPELAVGDLYCVTSDGQQVMVLID